MLFRAKIALRSVCDITPQLLEKLGVCGLLLDIDNTLTTHDNPVPAAGVEAWVAGMQAAGISRGNGKAAESLLLRHGN